MRIPRPILIAVGLLVALAAVSCGDDGESAASNDGDTTGTTASVANFYGKVTDESGAAVEHAALEIISKDGRPIPELAVVTDAAGEYDGPPLEPGDYTINVTANGFQKATKDAAISEGKTTQVDFVLKR